MNDRWEYTIPANTAETSKIRQECKVSEGFLTKLIVYFPAGCQNLARCRVFLGSKPIAPRSAGNYIGGEDGQIIFEQVNEKIKEDRAVLDWHLWNVDETYSHTIWMAAEWIAQEDLPGILEYKASEETNTLLRQMLGIG